MAADKPCHQLQPSLAPEGVDSEFVISFDGHFTDLRYAFRDMLVTVISIATYLFDLVSQTFSILQVRGANSLAIFIVL